jgi:hypothetical protein
METFVDFRIDSHIKYPPFANEYFEKYFYTYMTTNEGVYINNYIPVFWTETSHRNEKLDELQQKLYRLPHDKNYFTVVQHDLGLQKQVPPNTHVFSMGRSEGIPIPLTYENRDLFDRYKNINKTIFCSFVGAYTHPIRRSVVAEFLQYSDVVCSIDNWTNQIADDKQQLFLDVTSKSKFTLAPRGFGKTSFRLYEALKLGSIPVYIYDEPWLPYTEMIDWNKLAVLSHINDVPFLYDRLKSITDEEYRSMLAYYKEHEYLFTFEGMSDYVIQKFNSINQTPFEKQCAWPPVPAPIVSHDAPKIGLYKTSGNKIQFKGVKY